MILAGPVLPVLLTALLVVGAFLFSTNDLPRVWSILLLISALFSMVGNLWPQNQPITSTSSSEVYNDGAQLRALWYYRGVPNAYIQAVSAYQAEDYPAAAAGLLPYLEVKSLQPDTIRMTIAALLKSNDYERARQVQDTYGPLHRSSSDDLVNEGLIRTHFQDFDAALGCYGYALYLDPNNEAALNNRGYARLLTKQYREAVQDFRRALALKPTFAFAHNNLGLALLMLGETDEGLGHVRYSLRLDDANSYAYRNLGIYHLQQGELAEAQQQFDRAWALDPDTDLLAGYREQLRRRLDETGPHV
ncbi:tetratricopeptide repeat protein [Hymenobacter cellulosilyticus]|uniref:Tetratricopeptide repeat protein n=1 Tax=Hymenobacter cellulosilyticus TaxID=2932248 RepID=A0A8T9Q0Z8_9BACT|nr:tetratricopeptide repeat protein [Hymenobacter cellulosilyticus]UOQ70562.1 tetratricopeptide repeat protein [Hymenobacter cellulosilyticus]